MFDFITIGGATQDIFVECDCAEIMSLKNINEERSLLTFPYGEKIEIDQIAFDIGGGALNAATSFATLGFKTASILKIGKDLNGEAVLSRINEKNIDKSLLIKSDEYKTGFSIILTSYEGDRTVLMHRGANNHLKLEDLDFEKIKNTKWIYIASLSGESNLILDELAMFAQENNINMAFNPGSTQLKRGIEDLRKILETVEILIMNKVEASMITKITQHAIDFIEPFNDDMVEMLKCLKSYGPKVIVITEGKKGVHAYNGEDFYYAPPFPSKVLSTLGAGDAFASTFVASMHKTDWDVEKSLRNASINSSSVIEYFGAQTGLKTFDEIKNVYKENKSFKIIKKH